MNTDYNFSPIKVEVKQNQEAIAVRSGKILRSGASQTRIKLGKDTVEDKEGRYQISGKILKTESQPPKEGLVDKIFKKMTGKPHSIIVKVQVNGDTKYAKLNFNSVIERLHFNAGDIQNITRPGMTTAILNSRLAEIEKFEKGMTAIFSNKDREAFLYRAAGTRIPEAMYEFGMFFKENGSNKDAENWLQNAADAGEIGAKYHLGVLKSDPKLIEKAPEFDSSKT